MPPSGFLHFDKVKPEKSRGCGHDAAKTRMVPSVTPGLHSQSISSFRHRSAIG